MLSRAYSEMRVPEGRVLVRCLRDESSLSGFPMLTQVVQMNTTKSKAPDPGFETIIAEEGNRGLWEGPGSDLPSPATDPGALHVGSERGL